MHECKKKTCVGVGNYVELHAIHLQLYQKSCFSTSAFLAFCSSSSLPWLSPWLDRWSQTSLKYFLMFVCCLIYWKKYRNSRWEVFCKYCFSSFVVKVFEEIVVEEYRFLIKVKVEDLKHYQKVSSLWVLLGKLDRGCRAIVLAEHVNTWWLLVIF